MILLSTAFGNFESIPIKYSGEGEDLSPPLRWQDVPEGTRSFALICEDPDAPHGTWDHWIIYNIPSSVNVFAEGIKHISHDSQSLKNSWNEYGYGGPNPPSGTHRYFFVLYALDTVLQLPEEATKTQLREAMKHHILSEATLVGLYEKKNRM